MARSYMSSRGMKNAVLTVYKVITDRSKRKSSLFHIYPNTTCDSFD